MMATQYSCWHVFVIPLNLPPSSIMQRKHIFLTLIVPGPNYPGKNMSVYMQPLMDDLKEAWVNGVNTYDAAKKENFQIYVWYQYSLQSASICTFRCLVCAWKVPMPTMQSSL